MSDEELDRDWKPNGRRPQSTMARSFSQELMDIFRIENSISDLDKDVTTRKETVTKNTDELASLEARIKEMEDRLKRSAGGARPAIPTQARADQPSSSKAAPAAPVDAPPPPPPAKDDARSRPGTARAAQPAPSSGNMPPTPGASEDGHGE